MRSNEMINDFTNFILFKNTFDCYSYINREITYKYNILNIF